MYFLIFAVVCILITASMTFYLARNAIKSGSINAGGIASMAGLVTVVLMLCFGGALFEKSNKSLLNLGISQIQKPFTE